MTDVCMSSEETPDAAIRLRCREALETTLTPLRAAEVEQSIFDWCSSEASVRLQDFNKGFNSRLFAAMYASKGRQVADNLNPDSYVANKQLGEKVREGALSVTDLPSMSPQDMFPEAWHKLIDDKRFKDEKEYSLTASAITDKYKCKRCGGRKVTFMELQTRSADEGSTTFYTCLSCGNKWKKN